MSKAQFLPESNECNIYLKKEDGFVLLCDAQGKIIPCTRITINQEAASFVTAEVTIEVNGWFEDIVTDKGDNT